jgi:hypothetical protein
LTIISAGEEESADLREKNMSADCDVAAGRAFEPVAETAVKKKS